MVLLPGFGNNAADYIQGLPARRGQERPPSICENLAERGVNLAVLPVERTDWARGILGRVASGSFWAYEETPATLFGWYLQLVDEVVRAEVERTGERVVLVGHSAGGWLARAALADGTWMGEGTTRSRDLVAGLVTLGAPHFPPRPDTPLKDMTRGALSQVDSCYPGAFLKSEGISYVTVCGTGLSNPTGYEQVTGFRGGDGDGVVPLEAAHLEGALQLTLPGCFHSVTFPTSWYGSPQFLDVWLKEAVAPATPALGLDLAVRRLFGRV